MITKKCKDCGKEFTINDGEIDFYRSKGFELPNRCKSCRDKRKSQKAAPAAQSSNGKNSRSKSVLTAVLIAAVLLIALIVKVSDVITPVQTSLPEITDTSVYTAEKTTPAVTTSALTSTEITSELADMTTAAETTSAYPETTISAAQVTTTAEPEQQVLHFRSNKLLEEHYEKHGIDMGFSSAADYEAAAAAVVNSPNALHKIEKEDNDDVYYIESTNEFVIVSTDGYIRTYFSPDSGKDYFDRQ
ncbi:MAG: zinc-ribbon domain containing protein [Oscillospiraceae bacterium]|nr:zinc-ribbon domain containing protein [Oscillospiraceae bacterium]